jgi:hypothetical protein
MKVSDLKELLIRSLDKEDDAGTTATKLEEAGVTFRFSEGFRERILDRIYSSGSSVVHGTEFVRDLNYVFYRIAVAGVAAIVVLLITLFIVQGSFSLNSFLGMGNSYDESIFCLLTGN